MDGTQWTDHGNAWDESLLADDFFGASPAPSPIPVAFHPCGGQEDRSKVALVTGRGPRGIDLVVVGTDGHVYHAWADSAVAIADDLWDDLSRALGGL